MSDKRGEDVTDKLLLKRATKKKIDRLLQKPRPSAVAAYNLIKNFFKAYTEKDYEYTREELIDELDKVYLEDDVKQKVVNAIRELGKIEFANVDYSKQEIESLMKDFEEGVEHLVHAETMELGFWDRIVKKIKSHLAKHEKKEEEEEKEEGPLQAFVKEAEEEGFDEDFEKSQEEQTVYSEQEIPESDDQQKMEESKGESVSERQGSRGPTDKFDQLITEFNEKIRAGRTGEARSLYDELARIYERMSDENQHIYYDQLSRAYDLISSN